MQRPPTHKRVFISYARADESLVLPLSRFLRASGTPAFRDLDDLEFGKDWAKQLARAIEDAAPVLVFWSARAATAHGVAAEVRQALATPGLDVVPIILDDTPLPGDLVARHGVDLRSLIVLRESVPTIDDLEAAAELLEDGAFPRVETDLMEARFLLRSFVAVANSEPERWFVGSNELYSLAYFGLLNNALLHIWRLSDPSNPNSVPGTLTAAGMGAEAQGIIANPHVVFVRNYIRNHLLANNQSLLDAPSRVLPDRRANEVPFQFLSDVLALLSDSYLLHKRQGAHYLDPVRVYTDSFHESMKTRGLPGIDFEPADIYHGE